MCVIFTISQLRQSELHKSPRHLSPTSDIFLFQIINLSIGLRLTKLEEELGADTVEHGVGESSFKINRDTIDTVHCLLGLNHRDNFESNDRIASAISRLLRSTNEHNFV